MAEGAIEVDAGGGGVEVVHEVVEGLGIVFGDALWEDLDRVWGETVRQRCTAMDDRG